MAKTTTATAIPTNGNGDSALIQSFKAARRVSTPIVAIETDAAATIVQIRRVLTEKTPVLAWDCARGLYGLNDLGKAAVAGLPGNILVQASEALLACEQLPDLSVVFMHNFQRQMGEAGAIQALWNLRDTFKVNKRMIVVLGPAFQLPVEIAGDVIVLEEPLPTRAELSGVIDQQYKNVNDALKASGQVELALPDDATRAAVLDAVVGLAHYTTEQVTAMAITKSGISVPRCWDHKIKTLENTQGLKVWRPQPHDTTLDELKGLDNVIAYARQLIAADAFNVIVFIDEADKSFAGGMSEHTGDSGVGKDQVGQILTYMNDTKSPGLLAAGVAGSGKSQLPKAMGAVSGKPVIMLDMGGLKAGIVGQSEGLIRNALKVITATAEGRVLFIATANRTTIFTPEWNRRFRKQFFFDVLSEAGRKALWPVYVKKNGLTASQAAIPPGFDVGWTGAEIQAACEEAALFGQSVVDVARFIIPQSVSAKATIAQMRREAAGRFLSASYPGFYEIPADSPQPMAAQRSYEVN